MRVCVVFLERVLVITVFTYLFNQTVEREDDHRLLAELLARGFPSITVPLSAVFHIRYQVLSVFPPFPFWRPLEGVKMSNSAQESIDLLIIFRCLTSALALENPVSWRSLVSLKTSIWRCVRDNNIM